MINIIFNGLYFVIMIMEKLLGDSIITIEVFYIIEEKIAYMECVIQSSMFCSFYLFFSILLCHVDSALVSDSNAYIWISNCILLGVSDFIGKGEGVLVLSVT